MASTEVMIRSDEVFESSNVAPEHVQEQVADADDKVLQSYYGDLLSGEQINGEGLQCYLSLPCLPSRVFGQVFFSNYKLLFVPSKHHPSFASIEKEVELLEMLQMTTPVSYLCVASCKSLDDGNASLWSRSSPPIAPQSYEAELTTKDVRLIRYHFDTADERRQFLNLVNEKAFFGPSELPTRSFAPVYHQHRFKSGLCVPLDSKWQYSPVQEFERLQKHPFGVQFSLLDQGPDYRLFPTYPRYIIVPKTIDMEVMKKVSAYRSSKRVPAVDWIHPTNGTSLSRCSQPRTGFSTVSEEDQLLMKEIWKANPAYVETSENTCDDQNPVMLIMDARSRAAATANIVIGGGYEGTAGYGRCKIEFAGIANIHAVREAFMALASLCSENKITEKSDVAATQWYRLISTILTATMAMVEAMESGASVMTHCSDGWDRTSQLTSLVQIVLDPYARTAIGFAHLIQKDWLSFGHKFCERLSFGEPIIPNSAGASPIFLQFLDAVAAIIKCYPTSFEFSEHYLIRLFDLIHSGQFGNFLANCEAAYLDKFAKTTSSLWLQLEEDYRTKPELRNDHFNPQSGPISLATVIPSLDLWSAYFHRYNAQYMEQLKQKRMMFFSQHHQSLSDSLIGREVSAESSIWKRVFATAEHTDSVSHEVRSQLAYLHELLSAGQPECQVRLHFVGDEVVQMVVQQFSAYRVQKSVPSLKDVTLERYTPNVASTHPPNSLVVLSATSTVASDGTRSYQSKILSSNYSALVTSVASLGRMLWKSASSIVESFPWAGSYFSSAPSPAPGQALEIHSAPASSMTSPESARSQRNAHPQPTPNPSSSDALNNSEPNLLAASDSPLLLRSSFVPLTDSEE